MRDQMMAALPEDRVTPARAFTRTGVDYAGPINVRVSKGRGNKSYKGYISLFICLVTKAIHLEVVSDLTTDAFLAAFRRFVARRGLCKDIYSDNGTTFIGANKELAKERENALKQFNTVIGEQLSKDGIIWHFIPPAASHFGGLWEAGVKSTKYHLKRIVGDTTLTYEELATVVTQIEACLNSRPLAPLTSDITDLAVLTPGHFLIGDALLALPEEVTLEQDRKFSYLRRWKLLQKMYHDFWVSWSGEYLSRLQQRPKWIEKQPDIKIGELVMVKDIRMPPTKWPLARVIERHPGKDGKTRVVTLRLGEGNIMKRPITKISSLPISDNEENIVVTTEQTLPEISKAGNDSPVQLRRSKRKKGLFAHLLSLMLLLSMGHVSEINSEQTINVTHFQSQPGVYFDEIGRANVLRSEWNLVVYYDLTNYWLELTHLQNASHELYLKCQNNSTLMMNKESCLAMSKQVDHILKEITDRNQILQQGKGTTRNRRSPLDFIGTVANELFGVLDQRAAEKYDKHIDVLFSNQAHLEDLLKQQISIVETTANVIKRDRELIISHYEAVQGELQTVLYQEEYMDSALLIIINIMSFQNIQEEIIDVISDTYHGRFNNLLFTPDQLDQQLLQIQRALPAHLDMPTRQIIQLYKFLSIKARIVDEKVIFEIKFPLIDREEFQILNILSVPTMHNQQFVYIQPSSEIILVSLQRTVYYLATKVDFQNCQIIQQTHYMCNMHQPLHNTKSEIGRCELSLLRHESSIPPSCIIRAMFPTIIWTQLYKSNSWIFATDKSYTFDSICGNNITPVTITGSGILQLPVQCTLKGDSIVLYSRSTYTSYMNKSFLPTFNLTRHIIMQSLPIATEDSDIQYLQHSIKELKESQLPALPHQMNHHDIHHYAMVYILLIIAIITIVFLVIWRRKTSNSTISTASTLV